MPQSLSTKLQLRTKFSPKKTSYLACIPPVKPSQSIRYTNQLLALISDRPVLLRLLPSIWVLIDKYSKCKYTLSNLGTLIFKFTLAHIHSLHMHTIMLIETNQCPLTQLINSHMNPIKVTRNSSPSSFIRHLETLC